MRYTVICQLDSPFFTDWLLFPIWEYYGGDVVCIIDNFTRKYIQHSDWDDALAEPQWREIAVDNL